MSCSTDGGSNWTAVAFHTGGSIDFPRITVGQDGTVYVITRNGSNINLDSYKFMRIAVWSRITTRLP